MRQKSVDLPPIIRIHCTFLILSCHYLFPGQESNWPSWCFLSSHRLLTSHRKPPLRSVFTCALITCVMGWEGGCRIYCPPSTGYGWHQIPWEWTQSPSKSVWSEQNSPWLLSWPLHMSGRWVGRGSSRSVYKRITREGASLKGHQRRSLS